MKNPFQFAASLVMAVLVFCTLIFGLLPAVFAGTLLYICIRYLEENLPRSWPNKRAAGLTISILAVALVIFGLGLASGKLLGQAGIAGMLLKLSHILEQLRAIVPESWLNYLPDSVGELKDVLAAQLKEHAAAITQHSIHGFHQLVQIILASIIASLLGAAPPVVAVGSFSGPLFQHIANFKNAVGKVFGAQVKVALINTAITGTFLLVILPVLGYHVPFADIATMLTFVFGLIPVVGNLVSNTINVILALSVSPWLAIACLSFLILSHKLEYLLCARYVGQGVGAKTWELLTAMLAFEAIFGPIGFAAAPVIYAWVKGELRSRDLI